MGKIHRGIPHRQALELKRHYKLNTFVETGTHAGTTAAWAAAHFKRVYTIEYSDKWFDRAYSEHGHLRNVEYIKGNSADELQILVPRLQQPTMFWLDAHWSRDLGYGRPEFGECPVLAELDAITASNLPHVILIDDARLFLKRPPRPHLGAQWPRFEQLKRILVDNSFVVYVNEDVIIAEPMG